MRNSGVRSRRAVAGLQAAHLGADDHRRAPPARVSFYGKISALSPEALANAATSQARERLARVRFAAELEPVRERRPYAHRRGSGHHAPIGPHGQPAVVTADARLAPAVPLAPARAQPALEEWTAAALSDVGLGQKRGLRITGGGRKSGSLDPEAGGTMAGDVETGAHLRDPQPQVSGAGKFRKTYGLSPIARGIAGRAPASSSARSRPCSPAGARGDAPSGEMPERKPYGLLYVLMTH